MRRSRARPTPQDQLGIWMTQRAGRRDDHRRGHLPAARRPRAAWASTPHRLGDQRRRRTVHRLRARAADAAPGGDGIQANIEQRVRPDRRLPRRLGVLGLQLGGAVPRSRSPRPAALSLDQPGLRRAVVVVAVGDRCGRRADAGQCLRRPRGRRARAGDRGDQAVAAACGDLAFWSIAWRPAAPFRAAAAGPDQLRRHRRRRRR